MQQSVEVPRKNQTPSQVVIGEVLDTLESYLPQDKRVIVITDSNIHRKHPEIINRYEHLLLPLGESGKTLQTVTSLYGQLLEMEVDRSCFILGFGGGIVTDITGFVASTYMRGLRFGFIASTLLAQVDASVGGKNGVNFDGFKNMVGTFNQPDFVLCDTSLLDTLPEREFRAGLGEIIKSGLIDDRELFELFEAHSFEELRTDKTLLQQLITRSVQLKASIVAQDEQEQNIRRKLNLGHTFAHAIEKSSREFLHGEAVAIGTAMVAKLSQQEGLLTPEEHNRIVAVLAKMGLPTESGISFKKLIAALKSDKKRRADSISFILMEGIGGCQIRPYSIEQVDSWCE